MKNNMKTYSQFNGFQDVFAMFVNNNKPGYVVDIGCRNLIGSNSLLLLENDWLGVGADIQDYKSLWENIKNFNFFQIDVTIKDNIDLLFQNAPKIIDFLSLDVDEAGLLCLKNINFDKHLFKCICIEHDFYIHGEKIRKPQRDILLKMGYSLVIQTAAEDWYVNFNLLEDNISNIIKQIPKHSELVENEMPIILNWLGLN